MSLVYIFPDPNDSCFFKSKSKASSCKLRPWTLWTVDAHASVEKTDYAWWMAMLTVTLLKSQFHIFQKELKNFVCLSKMISLLLSQLVHYTYTFQILTGANLKCQIFPVWVLIRQAIMSILTAKIGFAPIFNLSSFDKPPLFVYFWFWVA